MPIDDNLARYSDLAFGSAVAAYLLALVLLIAEYASRSTAALDAAEHTPERSRILVGATMTPGLLMERPRRTLPDRLGRMGISVVIVALALHVASIALRGLATGRPPWGNMYEFVTLTSAAGVAAG